ncbi:MAG: glycosyltransferase family 4 protein, partial [Bdellovibrionales bacterium]
GKPTILFVSDVADFKGGAERSLFDAMATPGITPILVVPDHGPISAAAEDKDIAVMPISLGAVESVRRPFKLRDILRTFRSGLTAAIQLKRIAKQSNCAAIHTNGLNAHGVACLARLIGGRRVIAHFRAIPFTLNERLFWRAVQIIAYRLIFVSRPCWPWAALPANGTVIFNGIDLPVVPTVPQHKTPLTLGFTGRLHPSKHVDKLIDWVAHTHDSGNDDIRLIIRGQAEDAAYERELRALVQERGIAHMCTFEGKKEGLAAIYKDIDICVVPSITPDPLPRAVMEGQALGIPVIAYPAGGITDMIEDEVNGFLVTDRDEFHTVLSRIINDKDLYSAIGKAAQDNAKRNFSLQTLHEKLAAIYKSL